MMKFRVLTATAALLCLATSASADNGEVNVYTYRETKLIQPLFDAFTKDSGVKAVSYTHLTLPTILRV